MAVVKVWRLERNGKGAYNSGLMFEAKYKGKNAGKHKCDPWSHPDPRQKEEEGSDLFEFWADVYSKDIHNEWFFGFRSLTQFKKWCNSKKFREDLKELGGILVCYEVDKEHHYYGNHQVIFKKAEAKIVSAIGINF